MKNNTIKYDNKIVNKFKEGGEKSKEFLLKVQKVNENIKRTQTIKMVNNPNESKDVATSNNPMMIMM